jgi:hypothetical protein
MVVANVLSHGATNAISPMKTKAVFVVDANESFVKLVHANFLKNQMANVWIAVMSLVINLNHISMPKIVY